ncbi:MAG TPA: hypothetical protein VG944_09080 [Fimbriimonas sp.]|nr:hypothetical protein [Fimbriimonas sp.]
MVLTFALGIMAVAALGHGQRAEVFRLQFQRFQGEYKASGSASGVFNVKVVDSGAEISFTGSVASKEVKLHATTAFDPKGEKQVATLEFDGRTFKGTALIEGQDMTLDVKEGDQSRRLLIHRVGRSQGVFTLFQRQGNKPETEIFRVSGKRSG